MSSGRGCNHQMAILISSVMPCQAWSRLHWPVVGVQQAVRESVLELGAARHAHVIAIAIIPQYHCRNPGVAIVGYYHCRNRPSLSLSQSRYRFTVPPFVPHIFRSFRISSARSRHSFVAAHCSSEGTRPKDVAHRGSLFVGRTEAVGCAKAMGALCRDWYVCRNEGRTAGCAEAVDGGSYLLWRLSVFFVSIGARKRERKICEETRYVRRSL
jgi:hypothetical protein